MIVTAGLQQGLVEPSGYGSIKLEHFPLLCRTKEQHRSMLLYLLMTALIAEDYNLGGRQFESLRATLKLTPQDLVTSYRWALLFLGMLANCPELAWACDWLLTTRAYLSFCLDLPVVVNCIVAELAYISHKLRKPWIWQNVCTHLHPQQACNAKERV